MPQTVQPIRRGLNWGDISMITIAVAMALLTIGSLALSLMFDFRHTTAFAAEELRGHGFEKIDVLEKYTIGHGMGMPSPPIENWFDFIAIKNGENVEGRLICHRLVWDIEKSRCEILKRS